MRIVETFISIQGEGTRQGIPCIFVRTAGCNLSCVWCDTQESHNESHEIEITISEIMQEVVASGLQYVCITGGEPLLQNEELIPLVAALHEAGIFVDIETNGTISFNEVKKYASICMDVKCPSSKERSELSLLNSLRSDDSVKFVIEDYIDYQYMVDILASHPDLRAQIFITPVYGTDPKWLIERIIEDKLPVKFQLQLHKVVDIP
ncbi:MAG TPA: 4Fe-4S cluster-binding domain-containing protein [Methanocorpusculum sp.]|nr:4Fe-4S cluster-binding domain-containing protein [Methanocorpusculum sp.]